MLKLLLAATIVVASPAIPQTDTLPIDLTARAKAPHEDGRFVDALAALNRYVNDHIQGESDLEHYGLSDYWVQYPSDNKGDCEDFQITKMGMLGQVGFPIVTNTKLVGVIVHHDGIDEGHMILAVRLPRGTVLYLDNLNTEPMTRRELVAKHYSFYDWRA